MSHDPRLALQILDQRYGLCKLDKELFRVNKIVSKIFKVCLFETPMIDEEIKSSCARRLSTFDPKTAELEKRMDYFVEIFSEDIPVEEIEFSNMKKTQSCDLLFKK